MDPTCSSEQVLSPILFRSFVSYSFGGGGRVSPVSSDVTFFNHFSSSVGEIPLNLSSSFTRVNSVRFHVGDETHKVVVYDNLMYSGSFRLGDCGVKYVGTIHMSSERPTPVDFLRELGRLIQWDHGPTCVAVAQKFR